MSETPAARTPFSPWENLLKPSLIFGSCSGIIGVGVGSLSGILSSKHPLLFAVLAGGQWFLLGSQYQLARSAILEARPETRKREASTVAGAFAGGSVAGAIRGRANILPAAFMFGLFGYIGQYGYEKLDASHAMRAEEPDGEGLIQSWATSLGTSKWSPIKKLDNRQYQQLMRDKLLRVDAELAVIDEDIATLRKEQEHRRSQS